MTFRQFPSPVLPTTWSTGYETEDMTDLITHTSLECPTRFLQEKTAEVVAWEVVAAGNPGALWLWVETSPFPTANSVYWPYPLPIRSWLWTAIGGGGGPTTAGIPDTVPTAPIILAPTSVLGAVRSVSIPWSINSEFVRVVAWVPVAATPTTDYWSVQVWFEGKGG